MPHIDSDSDYGDSDYNPSSKPITRSKQNQITITNTNTQVSSKSKKKSTTYASKDGQGYAWEDEYKRSWDNVREDDSGSLEGAVNQLLTNKRKRIIRDTTSIQRGIIRHLCLVIDLSLAMTDRDLRPNRLEMSLNYAQEFVTEFFDQNPISQMCIFITKDAIAERLSPLSGNPVDHHKALSNKRKLEPSGEPSLQNALEMARATLAHLPPHGSKETLVIMGSLTTCDPEDIHTTIEKLEKDRMRVSIVGLSAEINICKEICRRTKGKYGVIMNETHFKELLFESIPPPPSLVNPSTSQSTRSTTTNTSSDLMQMGFPTKLSNPIPSLCACHSKLKSSGFICPRCGSKLCDVPTDCLICGLTVVSSPHLARSYRHLFPVANWKEINGSNENEEIEILNSCYGCSQIFSTSFFNTNTNNSQSSKYMCNRCKHIFCSSCDLFHEQLGLCPGCCT